MKQVKGTDPSPDPARHVLLRVPELKSQNLSQIRGSGEPALQPHQHPGKKLEAKRGKKGRKNKTLLSRWHQNLPLESQVLGHSPGPVSTVAPSDPVECCPHALFLGGMLRPVFVVLPTE